jgi:hypothetical protein
MPKLKMDRSILEAALIGFGHTLGEVTAKIGEIKRMLGTGAGTGAQTQGTQRTKKIKLLSPCLLDAGLRFVQRECNPGHHPTVVLRKSGIGLR